MAACPSGFYNNNGTCTACSPGCAECDSASTCLRCEAPKKLLNGHCESTCPDHTYTNVTLKAGQPYDERCLACDASCKTCGGPEPTRCRGCDKSNPPHAIFLNHTCVAQCPSGYVEDPIGKVCLACDSSCATCDDPQRIGHCVSCPPGKFLNDGNCVASCPAGTFVKGSVCESK